MTRSKFNFFYLKGHECRPLKKKHFKALVVPRQHAGDPTLATGESVEVKDSLYMVPINQLDEASSSGSASNFSGEMWCRSTGIMCLPW
eukprot:5767889-Amphidinium_carterae.1